MDMDLFARVRERLLDGTLWPLTEGNVLWNPGTGEPLCRLRRDHHRQRERVRGRRPGDDRSRARRLLPRLERRESALRLTLANAKARSGSLAEPACQTPPQTMT
jgi:hypothetical protein